MDRGRGALPHHAFDLGLCDLSLCFMGGKYFRNENTIVVMQSLYPKPICENLQVDGRKGLLWRSPVFLLAQTWLQLRNKKNESLKKKSIFRAN